jgi:hypothetical protein
MPSLEPSLALQGAIVTVLKAHTGFAALNIAIYDFAKAEAAFPYITVGEMQVIGDDIDCAEISEIISRIHVWSRSGNWQEAKTIAGLIRSALRAATWVLDGYEVEEVTFEQAHDLFDPDGKSRHIPIDHRFTINHL